MQRMLYERSNGRIQLEIISRMFPTGDLFVAVAKGKADMADVAMPWLSGTYPVWSWGEMSGIVSEAPVQGLADLLTAEPGGNFLTGEHTLRHCRDGLMPTNFTRMSREDWNKEGQSDLVARATECCKELLEKSVPAHLPDHVIREMDSIVERADKQLG